MEAGSPQMGAELGSDLINIERNLPCLLMAATARQTIHSEHTAAGFYWNQNAWKRGKNLNFIITDSFCECWHQRIKSSPKLINKACSAEQFPKCINGHGFKEQVFSIAMLYKHNKDLSNQDLKECGILGILLKLPLAPLVGTYVRTGRMPPSPNVVINHWASVDS